MIDDQLDEDAINFAVKWQGTICAVVSAVGLIVAVAAVLFISMR